MIEIDWAAFLGGLAQIQESLGALRSKIEVARQEIEDPTSSDEYRGHILARMQGRTDELVAAARALRSLLNQPE